MMIPAACRDGKFFIAASCIFVMSHTGPLSPSREETTMIETILILSGMGMIYGAWMLTRMREEIKPEKEPEKDNKIDIYL